MWAGQVPLGRAFWEFALVYGTLASPYTGPPLRAGAAEIAVVLWAIVMAVL